MKIPRKASLKKMRGYLSFEMSLFQKSDVIWSLGHRRKLLSKLTSKKLFTKFHSVELVVGFHDQQRKKKHFIQVKHISI